MQMLNTYSLEWLELEQMAELNTQHAADLAFLQQSTKGPRHFAAIRWENLLLEPAPHYVAAPVSIHPKSLNAFLSSFCSEVYTMHSGTLICGLLPMVNHSPKTLKGKFQKYTIYTLNNFSFFSFFLSFL
jgi:hypothetical protein